MKKLFDVVNEYVSQCTWKEWGCIKICAVSFGVLLGLVLNKEHKKSAAIISSIITITSATYLTLKFVKEICPICKQKSEPIQNGFVMRIISEE